MLKEKGKRKAVTKKMDNDNPLSARAVCCKRRKRFLKKAEELSILCGCDVGAIVFSPGATTPKHFPKSSVDPIIEKYQKFQDARRAKENHTLDLIGQNEGQSKKQDGQELVFSRMNIKELGNLSTEQLYRLEEQAHNYLKDIETTLRENHTRTVTELERRRENHARTLSELELIIANMREIDQLEDGAQNVADQDHTSSDSFLTENCSGDDLDN